MSQTTARVIPTSNEIPWPPPSDDFSKIGNIISRTYGEGVSAAKQQEFDALHDKIARELGYDLSQPMTSEYNQRVPMVRALKQDLKRSEQMFKSRYSYGTSAYGSTNPFSGTMEVRHCLTSLSDHAFCWMEKSSGVMWVGVCGMNEICVVTLSGHVDWKRVHGGLASTDPATVLSLFRKCVLSELEDLADPSSDRCKQSHRSFDMPFCVVSATPGTTETPNKSGHETSSVGYAAEAIDFVRSSGLLPKVQDSGASVRLAISAFERLIQKKCEANEIGVTVVSGLRHGLPNVKSLGISEIGDNLGTIEKTGLRAHLKAQQNAWEIPVPEGSSSSVPAQPSFLRPWPMLMDQTADSTSEILVTYGTSMFSIYDGKGFDDALKEYFFSNFTQTEKQLGYDFSRPLDCLPTKIPSGITYFNDRTTIGRAFREELKYHEQKFKSQYSYGTTVYGSANPFTGMMEERNFLTPFNEDFWWMEKSSGIAWVGVSGINEMCVVTLSGHVDWKRVHGDLASTDPKAVLSLFRKCVLSELEDLEDPFSECRQKLSRYEKMRRIAIALPFCVVSATPGTVETPLKSGYETSNVGYGAGAIDFVRSSGVLHPGGSIGHFLPLAISAFERLIQKKFEANEIEVTLFKNRKRGIPSVRDLDISEIRCFLDAVHNAWDKMFF